MTTNHEPRTPNSEYIPNIGLEIHVELLTKSKMFCGCPVAFGGEPNTRTCPVCLGMPGTLPVTNERAIKFLVKMGDALKCEIAELSQFHRKNYFYPDMPKDYQISQFDLPIASNGYLEVEREDESIFKVGITRVHMEEDTGKLMHASKSGRIANATYSLVDFNRAGTPLAETVTEPDITSPDDARLFLIKLKNLYMYLDVSDCNMEEGSLRVDANVSVRKKGQEELGTKTEVKNMNSFKALKKALTYEIERHIGLLESGERVIQETRHWDDSSGKTSSLRSKEEAHDYRYFPDPDLVPMKLIVKRKIKLKKKIKDKNKQVLKTDVFIIEEDIPELPDETKKRFIEEYNLSKSEAQLYAANKKYASYFEEAAQGYKNYKQLTNWIVGELTFHLKDADFQIDESAITPRHLIDLLKLIDEKIISGKMAKEVFEKSFETGKLPSIIVEEEGYKQVVDTAEIEEIVQAVLDENPDAVKDLKEGKDRALGFLVGQVMKLTKGQANPQVVNEAIRNKIGK